MDKYELVFDIIEHPHNYTSQELEAIMADPETRDIYNLLCKTDSALESHNVEVDVDSEWRNFSKGNGFVKRRFRRFSGRAASIVAIVCCSVVAMAVGIAVSVAISNHTEEGKQTEKVMNKLASAEEKSSEDTINHVAQTYDSNVKRGEILFENEPLSVIMDTVCSSYGLETRFENDEVASLHLYYKFDPSMELDEILEQLNTFESITITKEGNLLIID